MPLLPKPFPDEVVGSIVMRGCRRSGLPLKRFLDFVYGSRRSYQSLLMTSNPRRAADLAGIDSEELVRKHTVLPYSTAFLPLGLQLEMREKALNLASDECLASITQSVSSSVPYRRMCPICVGQDIDRYGESYWRRQHLLPGVEVCLEHRRRLHRTPLPLRGHTQSSSVVMPNEIKGAPSRAYLPFSILEALAEVSDDALNEKIPPSEDFLGSYRDSAQQLGYQLVGGATARRALALDLHKKFGNTLLNDMSANWSPKSTNPWPSLIVGSRVSGLTSRTPQHFAAPRHVLLRVHLATAAPGVLKKEAFYRPPGKKTRDYAQLDAKAADLVAAAVKQAIANNERVGVREILDKAGLWTSYRHYRDRFPATVAALEALRQSDQALRQAGRRPVWRMRLGLDRKLDKEPVATPST